MGWASDDTPDAGYSEDSPDGGGDSEDSPDEGGPLVTRRLLFSLIFLIERFNRFFALLRNRCTTVELYECKGTG